MILAMRNTYSLLLTACINPSAKNIKEYSIHRNDKLVRLDDYKTALSYWLNYPEERIESIVFFENSGSDLFDLIKISETENVYKRKVVFVQKLASDIPAGLHYGYSELEMIDQFFIDRITETNHTIKVTGRLMFPKLSNLLDTISEKIEFVSDCKDFKVSRIDRHYMSTTLMIFSNKFYCQHLYNLKAKMLGRSNGTIETLYFDALKSVHYRNKDIVFLKFPIDVPSVGFGAHWNKDYQSLNQKALLFVKNICKRITKSIWI